MYEQIKVRTVDARQWLLGVRQAALTTHDDIYRSLKPLLRGQQLSHSDRHYLAAVARDVVEQKGASMFVLLSAARFAEAGDDDKDLNPLPDIENLDDLLKSIQGYLASTAFLVGISHLLLSPRWQSPDIAAEPLISNFEASGKALKSLLDQVDISLGVCHLDYRQKSDRVPTIGVQNHHQVS